jgi:FAD:protein FMN transferase
MRKRILAVFILILFFTGACVTKSTEYVNIRGYAQGSSYNILFENKSKFTPEIMQEAVEKIFKKIDLSLSGYNDSSVISKINRNEDVVPDEYFTGVFSKSKEISILTDGAFDITVAPLVKAWGFGPDEHKNFDRSKLDSLMNLIGFRKVDLINGKIAKSNPAITLDVNAIAQGYTVDIVCGYFDSLGMKSYLVEIGGEVRVKGKKGSQLWKIGIDKPIDNNMVPGEKLQAIIKLKDKALSTSGNYRKFYVEDGVKYSHTIDPKTGFPAKNRLLSASVIADDCSTADAMATAFMVMGLERSIEFIKKDDKLEAFLVYSDDNGKFLTWSTAKLRKYISGE